MPVVFLERIPLPRLSTYITFSFGLLTIAVFHVQNKLLFPSKNGDSSQGIITANSSVQINEKKLMPLSHAQHVAKAGLLHGHDSAFVRLLEGLLQETWCFWAVINMGYCILVLIGKTVQNVVFGELRVIERQHIRDKFWNFVFYKFIFVFGVLNVQTLEECLLWACWFSVLGFFNLLTHLTRERFEYLSFSPRTTPFQHFKLLMLLCLNLCAASVLGTLSLIVGIKHSLHMMCFMGAEVSLLALCTVHVIARYGIHLYDQHEQERFWEGRPVLVYYTDLLFETCSLAADLAHHVHMLVWSNIFLSMASLVICMQLRYLYYELSKRLRRHQHYRHLVATLTRDFPEVSAADDLCAICWEALSRARKLFCGHLFHDGCLRSWLEQDDTCPTCRKRVEMQSVHATNAIVAGRNPVIADMASEDGRPVAQQLSNRRHFIRLGGSNLFSWLPSLQLDVVDPAVTPNMSSSNGASDINNYSIERADGALDTAPGGLHISVIEHLISQVASVFPHIPTHAIRSDLLLTGSVERTIDHILEGRITVPTSALPRGPMQVHLDSRGRADVDVDYWSSEDDNSDSSDPHHRPSASSIQQQEQQQSLYSMNVEESAALNNNGSIREGNRFSKNSFEREGLLAQRKLQLLLRARDRFTCIQQTSNLPMSNAH